MAVDTTTYTLGCKYYKGRYPKLVNGNYPHGIKFHNGQLSMLKTDYDDLYNRYSDFQQFLKKKEIFRVGGRNPIPENPHRVEVIRGEGSSTGTMNQIDTTRPEEPKEETEKPSGLSIELEV